MNDPEEINPAQPNLRDDAVGGGCGVLIAIWFLLFGLAAVGWCIWCVYQGLK